LFKKRGEQREEEERERKKKFCFVLLDLAVPNALNFKEILILF